jgi:hypothetical protein
MSRVGKRDLSSEPWLWVEMHDCRGTTPNWVGGVSSGYQAGKPVIHPICNGKSTHTRRLSVIGLAAALEPFPLSYCSLFGLFPETALFFVFFVVFLFFLSFFLSFPIHF